MSLNDILNKAISGMSSTSDKKVVIDMSDYFEYWDLSNARAKDNYDEFRNMVVDKLSFMNKDILIKSIESSFNFGAAMFVHYLSDMIKSYPEEFRNISELVVTNTKFTNKNLFRVVVERGRMLSELGDFTDEYMAKIISQKGATLVVRRTELGKDMPIRLDDNIVYYIYDTTHFDLQRVTEVPKGMHLSTPITLYNNVIQYTLVATGDTAVITLNGDSVIRCNLPIDVTQCETLIINGEGTLILDSGDRQPCIGSRTCDNLSFGRWSIGKEFKCKRICISGVSVIVHPGVPYFSIGRYGTNDMIDIELWNGGSINAPELTGKRIIVQQAYPPEGSTKISENMVYGIK